MTSDTLRSKALRKNIANRDYKAVDKLLPGQQTQLDFGNSYFLGAQKNNRKEVVETGAARSG